MIHIQFREAAGDVVQQHVVVSDNTELVRRKALFVVVQDIGDPVHGHSGLAASGHPLDDNVFKWGLADDLVLLFLYGGDNVSQNSVFVLG